MSNVLLPTALPILTEIPSINGINGLNLTISWDPWNCTIDYGAGQVEGYQVRCWENDNRINVVKLNTSSKDQHDLTITFSKPGATYECGVSVFEIVSGDTIAGPMGPTITGRTGCGGG